MLFYYNNFNYIYCIFHNANYLAKVRLQRPTLLQGAAALAPAPPLLLRSRSRGEEDPSQRSRRNAEWLLLRRIMLEMRAGQPFGSFWGLLRTSAHPCGAGEKELPFGAEQRSSGAAEQRSSGARERRSKTDASQKSVSGYLFLLRRRRCPF